MMQKLLWVGLTASWVMAMAILSVQNATPVSVKFLGFRSVELPFGVVLSFGVAGGMLGMALLLLVLGSLPRRAPRL